MSAYYNENDPKAAAWLRELIAEKLIPSGVVDERSITDVSGNDLIGFTQCHFFAGIGGWPYALQLAGWPNDRPVGTGSCPCQPFSAAGNQLGTADERHLWPAWFRLIAECREKGQRWTDAIFGEQVASAVGFGWLDGVSSDLEGKGYAVGAAVLGAHSVGAPHIRQRLYWLADLHSERFQGRPEQDVNKVQSEQRSSRRVDALRCCDACGLANPEIERRDRRPDPAKPSGRTLPEDDGRSVGLGNAIKQGLEGLAGHGDNRHKSGRIRAEEIGPASTTGSPSYWDAFDVVHCRDGKARRIESGTFPLAHGVPGRVGLLRGYGNAIVPQAAAEFVKAFLEIV